AVHLTNNEHLIYLPHYIHTNPLSLNYGGSTSIVFLEKYRWSSFPDYIGVDNFPSITERPYLLEIFGGESLYRFHTENCLKHLSKEEMAIKVEDAILK
ncbi:MAG: hypothetical protein ABFR82_15725, partial [Nitrospirota bacterium]